MTDDSENVVKLDQVRKVSNGGNGDGGGRDVYERLARIEAHMQHMATRAWVLGGVVGGMAVAATITLVIMRIFGELYT